MLTVGPPSPLTLYLVPIWLNVSFSHEGGSYVNFYVCRYGKWWLSKHCIHSVWKLRLVQKWTRFWVISCPKMHRNIFWLVVVDNKSNMQITNQACIERWVGVWLDIRMQSIKGCWQSIDSVSNLYRICRKQRGLKSLSCPSAPWLPICPMIDSALTEQ